LNNDGPGVSIIIVNFNNRTYLLRTLESLFQDPFVAHNEIIVVDNASEDDSLAALRRDFPAVKTIALPENFGYARANNRGAEKATGRYLLFLNSDTEVPAGAVEKLLDIKRNHPEYGIIAPMVDNPDGSLQLSWGSDLHLHTEFFLKFIAKGWSRWRLKTKKTEVSRDVDWVSGACFMIDRNLYQEIGGFDEKFFLYVEDADLGKRVRQLGHKVHLTSEVRIVHHLGQSVAGIRGRAMLEAKRSQLYYYGKHNGRRAMAVLRRYLLFRFGWKRWMSREEEARKIYSEVIDMIREFRFENSA
jgi:N-acetylglucosaminyl-diphospho-decaprenol L-rhamnosyltransferase